MKKHKNKIITAAVIIAVLAGAWFYGGNFSRSSGAPPPAAAQDTETHSMAAPAGDAAASPRESSDAPTDTINGTDSTAASDAPEAPASPFPADTPGTDVTEPVTTSEPSPMPAMIINPDIGTDRFLTDPVPEGRPLPVEPEDVTIGDGAFTVYLTVRADTILNNMNMLHRDKHELVPDDGVIFPLTAVTAHEGESVFNVLQREMRRNRIHLVSRFTPIYNSAYVEAINNLYEFDAGELSGWKYSVNGWFPNFGSSRYRLQPGDVIGWYYTCDLGRDLGTAWE